MVQELVKAAVSSISTLSVESMFGACETSAEIKMNIGQTIEEILAMAQKEGRLISGLNNASRYLKETENPEQSLFFFIAPSSNKDSVTHMQEVVLQSFCFENDIYIIKLDNAAKLTNILGSHEEIACALVQRSLQTLNKSKKCSDLETALIDHCEEFWGEPIQPIIKLPEK